MGLLSFLKRRSPDQTKAAVSKPSKEVVDAVQQARARARQRLIGAAVLVVAGVIGFPLLFATQPRPLPVDTPIEIARRDGTVASARATAPAPVPNVIVNETAADAGREMSPPPQPEPEAPKPAPEPAKPAHKPADKPAAESHADRPAPKPTERERKPAEKPAEKPADKPATKPAAKQGDDARAQALLNGQDASRRGDKPAAESGGRFVVQVGAFSEMSAAREARQKVEKLGLKTYTQVVETSNGSRVRVRVGPFADRVEADRAAGKIKAAGLGSAVFTL